jgi:predicted nucleic-acid-binding Zn-ribbon protein
MPRKKVESVEPGKSSNLLSEEQLQKLEDFFANREVAVNECPFCGSEHYNVAGFFQAPAVVYEQDRSVPTGQVWVLVGIACQNCSYVMFFSAKDMGLLE